MSEHNDESMRNRRTSKRILAIGLPLVLIAGAGVGYAYYVASGGTGTGTATADSTTQAVVMHVGSATGLYPGKTVNLAVTGDNPNDYSVALSNVAITSLTTTQAGCNPAATGVSSAFTPAASLVLAKNAVGAALGTVAVTMTDDLVNDQTSCRGAVFS